MSLEKFKRIENRSLLDAYHTMSCIVCKSGQGIVAHHIKSKGSGGHDVCSNLVPVCFHCHRQIHDKGLSYVAEYSKDLTDYLISFNWIKMGEKWVNLSETH